MKTEKLNQARARRLESEIAEYQQLLQYVYERKQQGKQIFAGKAIDQAIDEYNSLIMRKQAELNQTL